ncbi:MAG: DUF4136 domain-containing protein [Cytophagaceae bacterium]
MKTLLYLFIVCGLLSSCDSVQIYSEYDRSVNFTQYKTYAWLATADSSGNFFNNQIVNKNFKYYADQEMAARGYRLDPENPDILLEERISSQKKSYTTSTPVYSYPNNNPYSYNSPYYYNGRNWYRPYNFNNSPTVIGYNYQQVEYNEGTLLVDAIDRKLNQLVWRGWSVGDLNDMVTSQSELQGNVHKIFQKYPVPTPQMTRVKKKLQQDDQY